MDWAMAAERRDGSAYGRAKKEPVREQALGVGQIQGTSARES